jgi:mycothiol synthase
VNVRRPAEADAPAVTALVRAVEQRFAGKPEQSEDDLRGEWDELDLGSDAWLVEVDDRLAGYAALFAHERPYVDGYVHPDLAGRGIGSHLVELAETDARRRGLSSLRIPVFGNDERAQALLEARGYRPVRRFYRMEVELEEEPAAPVWPDGLHVVPYDDADAEAFHAALDEAFAEEWGHEPDRDVDWREVRERRSPDRSCWAAVKDGEEIAAAIVAEEEHWGVAWVHSVGVRPRWRRRGLGKALLLHTFGELYRRGRRHIGLGVDAENPTDATRLYEAVGMHVSSSFVYFERDLRE